MRRKIKFMFIVLMVVSMLVLSVCGISFAKRLVIGYVPMTMANEFYVTMIQGAKMMAEKLDVQLIVQAPTRHISAEEQMQILENLIERKVDAIVLVPVSSTGVVSAVKKAQDAGIPVVNVDVMVDRDALKKAGCKITPFIGSNNFDGARIAGWYALSRLGGFGKVALLTGVEGQANTAFRRDGFKAATEGVEAQGGKLEIVAQQTANWEVELAYNVFQNILQGQPDLDLVFASNDNMALGAIQAIKDMGKEGEVIVIGYDAIPAAVDGVKKGTMDASVAQYPGEMGKQGVEAAVKMAQGEEIPDITWTPVELISKANVTQLEEYLKEFE